MLSVYVDILEMNFLLTVFSGGTESGGPESTVLGARVVAGGGSCAACASPAPAASAAQAP